MSNQSVSDENKIPTDSSVLFGPTPPPPCPSLHPQGITKLISLSILPYQHLAGGNYCLSGRENKKIRQENMSLASGHNITAVERSQTHTNKIIMPLLNAARNKSTTSSFERSLFSFYLPFCSVTSPLLPTWSFCTARESFSMPSNKGTLIFLLLRTI